MSSRFVQMTTALGSPIKKLTPIDNKILMSNIQKFCTLFRYRLTNKSKTLQPSNRLKVIILVDTAIFFSIE
ncbi:hypothetical protein BpHYR1_029422 [Brachionus plicatilis]|uniref:Uncharacterized protein n=1 Tax=Brachionus plicatilis TaxID=10195 RepID=A0A3M7PPY0_BRAPC|nr:hypothetical protein BpHYR1_029422 [Brachionus plicatilis]